MPLCKNKQSKYICPISKKECENKTQDNRKKETYTFNFKFSAEKHQVENFPIENFDEVKLLELPFFNIRCRHHSIFGTLAYNKYLHYRPPLLITKPSLEEIQVFRL